MVTVKFEHFPIDTKLFSCDNSVIKMHLIEEINFNYKVNSKGEVSSRLIYRTNRGSSLDPSDIGKTYFTSEKELLQHIINQM